MGIWLSRSNIDGAGPPLAVARVAPRGDFFVDHTDVLSYATLCHECRIREGVSIVDAEFDSYGALSIAVSASFLSHFSRFVTCVCISCPCVTHASLTCCAIRRRCSHTKTRLPSVEAVLRKPPHTMRIFEGAPLAIERQGASQMWLCLSR